jgi:alpha-beta hydrolase superfamily lysophospholipase
MSPFRSCCHGKYNKKHASFMHAGNNRIRTKMGIADRVGSCYRFLMHPNNHSLTMTDGTSLFVSDYLLPAADCKGGVAVMHGIGEHSGRYRHIAEFLNEAGWSVRTYDHRGHGQSQGRRGDVRRPDDILEDAKVVIDEFAMRCGGRPFLLGHSMGGLFAAHFALARMSPLRGLILSSPALAVPLTSVQKALLKIMMSVAPHVGVPNGLQSQFLSHDTGVVAAYQADPLVHGKISASLLGAMLASVAYCESGASGLAIPALMMVAGDDHLVDAEGSKRFFAQLPAGKAQFALYEDFYHELFNETGRARPLAELRAWLTAQDAFGVK